MIKYRINVLESERGWGQERWTEDFPTLAEAKARIQEINSKNTSPTAPDYYVQAEETVLAVEEAENG